MKKKDKKAIKKIIRKEIYNQNELLHKDLCGIMTQVRSANDMAERNHKMTTALNHNVAQSLFSNIRYNTQSPKVKKPPVTELKTFKGVKLSKKEKKKLIKKLRKECKSYIDSELYDMCAAIIRHFNEELGIENKKCGKKCNRPSAEGVYVEKLNLDQFEEFCREVLCIPPEFILGPNYKDHQKEDEGNSEDDNDMKPEDSNEDLDRTEDAGDDQSENEEPQEDIGNEKIDEKIDDKTNADTEDDEDDSY